MKSFSKFFALLAAVLFILTSIPTFLFAEKSMKTIYDYSTKNITGEPFEFSSYQGQVLLLVNTASRCGYTSQYAGLQSLYERFSAKGLVVIGIPSNDFGGQEPGNEDEIQKFCSSKFGVSFPMTAKTKVSGLEKSELFRLLTSSENPDFSGEIQWNFEKMLISRSGELLGRFRSGVEPESKELVSRIEQALAQS